MRKVVLSIVILMFGFILSAETGNYVTGKIEIKSKHLPMDILEKAMSIKEGKEYKPLDSAKTFSDIKKIKYVEDVVIVPIIREKKVDITIEITEKPDILEMLKKDGIIPETEREKIDRTLVITTIDFEGLRNITADEMMKVLPFKVGDLLSKDKVVEGSKKLFETGYFQDVTPDVYKIGKEIYVKFTVAENPLLEGITVEGNKVLTDEELTKDLVNKKGKVLNSAAFENDMNAISKIYQEKGYFLSSCVNIRYVEGSLVFYVIEGVLKDLSVIKKAEEKKEDNVLIKEPETTSGAAIERPKLKTQQFVIDREIELKKGEIVTLDKVRKSVANLMKLGLFKDGVNPRFERDPSNPEQYSIILEIEEIKNVSIMGSLGGSSDGSISYSASVADPNFFGNAWNTALNFEGSSKGSTSYSFTFEDPWVKGTDRLSLGASIYNTKASQYDETKTVAKTGVSLSAGKGFGNELRLSARVKSENVKEYDTKNVQTADYMINAIYPRLTYTTVDNPANPGKGDYASLGLEIGNYGDQNRLFYGTAELDLRKYHEFLDSKNVMAYRLMVGGASGSTRDAQSFVVGGSRTVRGYKNFEFTGKQELVLNIENRYEIDESIKFAVFIDVGRAWNEWTEALVLNDIKKGVGFGFRMVSPLGPLRFDFAWPVLDSKAKGGMKFYFDMGATF